MKKLFLLAVGLAMTLTACQKDEGLVSDGATSQTITVTIPQGMQTRATAADFGNGAKIDRCLLQIYHRGRLRRSMANNSPPPCRKAPMVN